MKVGEITDYERTTVEINSSWAEKVMVLQLHSSYPFLGSQKKEQMLRAYISGSYSSNVVKFRAYVLHMIQKMCNFGLIA